MGDISKPFNDGNKLPYEITMPIGDWSNDGHGKVEEITFLSSHSVQDLQKAYLKSVADTGLTFDHDHEGIQICTEYEDNRPSAEAREKLQELGYDVSKISEEEGIEVAQFSDMLLWFIKRSLPEFEYEVKKKTYLNGHWDKQLNVGFGYGLFD